MDKIAKGAGAAFSTTFRQKATQWFFGKNNAPREVIIVSQAQADQIIEKNFQERVRQATQKSPTKK